MQPQRRNDQAEGKAGDPGDQRAGEGREKKNRDVEKRSVHVPAQGKASSACVGSPT